MSPSSALPLNPWEIRALKYEFPAQPVAAAGSEDAAASAWRQLPDQIIYPGLYSASGFDAMAFLLRIMSRPNPQIELGAIDCSVALVVCDLELPDVPIIHVSHSFSELTGYPSREVLGRNCRFLQNPPRGSIKSSKVSDKPVQLMQHAIQMGQEIQLEIVNYKKNGKRFTNLLSIIPLDIDEFGHRYAVGFQVEVE